MIFLPAREALLELMIRVSLGQMTALEFRRSRRRWP